jgi:hypothetical protein
MRILLCLLVVLMSGCASAPVKTGTVYGAQENHVYSAIKQLLQRGVTVNLMLEYSSSSDGLPDGQIAQDYGCQTDKDIFMDTEKYFLLEAFSKYPNFSIVDRSNLDKTMGEINLGMKGVTSSTLEPGQMRGATHMLIIEEKNNFAMLFEDTKDHYLEIKKLLDMQKDTVVAIDRFAETRRVEYKPVPRETPAETRYVSEAIPSPSNQYTSAEQVSAQVSQSASQSASGQQAPASNLKENEVITIYGSAPVSYDEPVVARNVSQAAVRQQAAPQTFASTIALPAGQLGRAMAFSQNQPRPQNKMQDWQLARMLKQQNPQLRNKEDKTLVQNFIKKHPAFRNRVIIR